MCVYIYIYNYCYKFLLIYKQSQQFHASIKNSCSMYYNRKYIVFPNYGIIIVEELLEMTKTMTGAREGVYITIPTQQTTCGNRWRVVQRFMSPPSVHYHIAKLKLDQLYLSTSSVVWRMCHHEWGNSPLELPVEGLWVHTCSDGMVLSLFWIFNIIMFDIILTDHK